MVRHFLRRTAAWSMAAVVLGMCGCSLFPESMQPEHLTKWNRGAGPTRDPFFSVQDPTAADPTNENSDDVSVNPESL